ncbi:helix-turn-helix domain-containing protein [Jiangella alba]|uniref:AraC-type DNA-binding protein n=1 Tax=Jiangella alba TaxID=561176 RepID=A0A1H5PYR3_9ACTN|nr:helix-turn-helix domain-containing protein [Jiangella alba]SEF18794.1 AraC-type DNA-binding protein [Jiangella alba]
MDDVRPDRLRGLLDTILTLLDEHLEGSEVAGRAFLSRFHFDRLVASGLGETPGAFRRRLLLERSAWQLSHGATVTEAGMRAGYGFSEAFSRAFSRAYGVPPGRFPAEGRDFRLVAPNGIHFHGPGGLWLSQPGGSEGTTTAMDLTDRLVEHDHWLTGRLLERAAELPGDQLDVEVRPRHQVLDFDGPETTVRAMLDRLVWTKEVWCAAIEGRELPDGTDRSVAGLRTRWGSAGAQWLRLVRRIRDHDEWNDGFVDAPCDPPQSFSLGGVVAHVVTFSAHRREVLGAALAELGVAGLDPGCPIEWERGRATERAHPPGRLRGTAGPEPRRSR